MHPHLHTSPAYACGYSPRTPAHTPAYTREHMHTCLPSAHVMPTHNPYTPRLYAHTHTCHARYIHAYVHAHLCAGVPASAHTSHVYAHATITHTHLHYAYVHSPIPAGHVCDPALNTCTRLPVTRAHIGTCKCTFASAYAYYRTHTYGRE